MSDHADALLRECEPLIEELESRAWFLTVPVISMGHVTEKTYDALTALLPAFCLGKAPDSRPDTSDAESVLLYLADCAPNWPLHPDLERLAAWASARDYEWVRLDAEGSEVPDLYLHDWLRPGLPPSIPGQPGKHAAYA